MARLIDSSVFIELERRGQTISALDTATRGEPVAMASITASELLVGVHRSNSAQRRLRRLRFVETMIREVPVLNFDLNVARTHARLLAELAATGRVIGPNDLLIAATGLTNG